MPHYRIGFGTESELVEHKVPNTNFDPVPCCEEWSEEDDTYYCPKHMTHRVAKEWTWLK
jgi:hypothetical protein